ncbi:hypothetical protein DFS33DRAFT_980619 [Desarmillaria ectypa]|nr:hypothetical protein DFS33DRAFT_980619 [Desarmillaria ectypa]
MREEKRCRGVFLSLLAKVEEFKAFRRSCLSTSTISVLLEGKGKMSLCYWMQEALRHNARTFSSCMMRLQMPFTALCHFFAIRILCPPQILADFYYDWYKVKCGVLTFVMLSTYLSAHVTTILVFSRPSYHIYRGRRDMQVVYSLSFP